MDNKPVPSDFPVLSSMLDDPRRIQLRGRGPLDAYHERGATEDIIELAHEVTKLRPIDALTIANTFLLFQGPFMQTMQYSHDRNYPLQPVIRLPEPTLPAVPFGEVIRRRRSMRNFTGRPLALAELGSLLFGALGETGHLSVAHAENHLPVAVSLRTIPSGGALHPTGMYVLLLQEGEVTRGAYHYDVPGHSLELVKPVSDAESQQLLRAFPIHPEVVDLSRASAVFLVVSKFWRARAKYGDRGYRYCLLEAGSACQNLCLTAVALGLGHVVIGGFYDDQAHAWLGIDGIDHAILIAVAVGTRSADVQEDTRHVDQ